MIVVDIDMPNSCSECLMCDMLRGYSMCDRPMGYCMVATLGCPDRLIKDASVRQNFCPILGELDLKGMVKCSLKDRTLDPEQEKLNMALARIIMGFDKEESK